MNNLSDFSGLLPKIGDKVGFVGREVMSVDYLSVNEKTLPEMPKGDELWYKSIDNEILTVYPEKAKNALGESVTILSHEKKGDLFVIKFSDVVTVFDTLSFDDGFIRGNGRLTMLYLSKDVTSESSSYAFNDNTTEMEGVWCNGKYSEIEGFSGDVQLGDGSIKIFLFNAS